MKCVNCPKSRHVFFVDYVWCEYKKSYVSRDGSILLEDQWENGKLMGSKPVKLECDKRKK